MPGWIRPSNWYLTGFLVPRGAPPEQRSDDDAEDDSGGEVPEGAGLAEESAEDLKAAKRGFYPSSIGLSFLVGARGRDAYRDGPLGRLREGRGHRGAGP